MLKYRPVISIRTDLSDPSLVLEAYEETPAYDTVVSRVEKYSITPRTLKSVIDFVIPTTAGPAPAVAREDSGGVGVGKSGETKPVAATAFMPENYISIEEYAYGDNTVLRYAIKADLITADETNKILGEGSSEPKVASSVRTSVYTLPIAKTATLHTLEKDIIIKAITSFTGGSGIKTNVIDIFERTSGGPVNINSNGHPKTHSVILYFTDSEVWVIDPSNFLFSSHLENTEFSTVLKNKGLPALRTLHKEVKIYTPVGDQGYTFDKYRNCTDITVKIAFALNRKPLDGLNEASIKSHTGLIAISNNGSIDKTMIVTKVPYRIKQASNLALQNVIFKIQGMIGKKSDILDVIDETRNESSKLRSEYKEIISTSKAYTDIVSELMRLDSDSKDIISLHFGNETSEMLALIGVINSE